MISPALTATAASGRSFSRALPKAASRRTAPTDTPVRRATHWANVRESPAEPPPVILDPCEQPGREDLELIHRRPQLTVHRRRAGRVDLPEISAEKRLDIRAQSRDPRLDILPSHHVHPCPSIEQVYE